MNGLPTSGLLGAWPVPAAPHSFAAVVLFLGACLDHAVLMIGALNCLYGTALPHKLLSVTRKLDGVVVLAGPVLFWFAFGFHLEQGTAAADHHPFVYAYFIVCWLLGLVVFPALTGWRLLRRSPAALVK